MESARNPKRLQLRTSYAAPARARTLFLSAKWLEFVVSRACVILAIVLAMRKASPFELAFFTNPLAITLVLLLGVYISLATGISKLLYRTNQKRAHVTRTARALSIVADLKEGLRPQYCLYLRPFLTSSALSVPNSRFRRHYFPSMDRFFGRRLDLETVFAAALERQAHPLIAIGDTGFELGAAKVVSSDKDWRAVFTNLANGASAILMVPLPKPSTLWEIEHLITNPQLLRKTLFVMPMRLRSGVQETLEPFWHEVREKMRGDGIEFPALNPRGGLFLLREAGSTLHLIDSGAFDIDYIDRVLAGLIRRDEIGTLFTKLSAKMQSAFPDFIDAFLYFSPENNKLLARPLPFHVLPESNIYQQLLHALLAEGFLIIHRSQEGAQAWREVHLHPAILDWDRLRSWSEQRYPRLRDRGILIETASRARADLSRQLLAPVNSALAVFPKSKLAETADGAKWVGGVTPKPVTGPLRPEEARLQSRLA